MAYLLLRVSLGVNFFGHGFFRLLRGAGAFAETAVKGIDKGPLPHSFTFMFLYTTPFLELSLGVLLILGLFTRVSLVIGALFMIALTIGTTSIQNWEGAATQLEYSLVFIFMLWFVEANSLSFDGLMARRRTV